MKDVVNIDAVPLRASAMGSRFAAEFGEIGQELGLRGLGAMLHVVPPGKIANPFHRHHVSDEMFYVVSGQGEYRVGEERIAVGAGDCLGAPAGGKAHQIINTGREPLRYIGLSNNTNAEVVEYPDSGRVRVDVGATGFHFTDATYKEGLRPEKMAYWEGEDIGDES